MPLRQVNRFWGTTAWRSVATGFGAGFVPVVPGTAGTLLALPLWYWGDGWGTFHFAALGVVLVLAIPAAGAEMRVTGRKDPPTVVIDEVAGMLLAATAIPWGWRRALLLFLLFRFFDIVKFGPAAWADAREGPFYVVADDIVAGIYAHAAYRVIAWMAG